jgi:enamine deaminase RidA (YjgF/YER057c/UK114 family)
MPKNTRRKFIAGAVPAVALAAAPVEARQGAGAQPARKRVYRKLTPTSKTFAGQPLYSPELSFGNLVFVSGKGAGVDAKGDITEQAKNVPIRSRNH